MDKMSTHTQREELEALTYLTQATDISLQHLDEVELTALTAIISRTLFALLGSDFPSFKPEQQSLHVMEVDRYYQHCHGQMHITRCSTKHAVLPKFSNDGKRIPKVKTFLTGLSITFLSYPLRFHFAENNHILSLTNTIHLTTYQGEDDKQYTVLTLIIRDMEKHIPFSILVDNPTISEMFQSISKTVFDKLHWREEDSAPIINHTTNDWIVDDLKGISEDFTLERCIDVTFTRDIPLTISDYFTILTNHFTIDLVTQVAGSFHNPFSLRLTTDNIAIIPTTTLSGKELLTIYRYSNLPSDIEMLKESLLDNIKQYSQSDQQTTHEELKDLNDVTKVLSLHAESTDRDGILLSVMDSEISGVTCHFLIDDIGRARYVVNTFDLGGKLVCLVGKVGSNSTALTYVIHALDNMDKSNETGHLSLVDVDVKNIEATHHFFEEIVEKYRHEKNTLVNSRMVKCENTRIN